MPKSKQPKQKKEETTAEFVQRMNQQGSKRNGLRSPFVWKKRRHPGK